MGNSSSSRKVTVEKDGQGMIRITQSVVDRLEREMGRQGPRPVDATSPNEESKPSSEPPTGPAPVALPPAPSEPLPPQKVEEAPSAPPKVEEPRPKVEPLPVTTQREPGPRSIPLEQFLEDARLAAVRMKQEKEAEVRAIEEQWRQRLAEMHEAHLRNTKVAEAEFEKAVKDVNNLLRRDTAQPMCEDLKAAVQTCYMEHPRQVLRCADLVREFTSTVQEQQVRKLVKGVS